MVNSPRRFTSAPIKGDRWRHQTVQGHIAHPPRQKYQSRTVQGHIDHPPREQYRSQTVQDHIAHRSQTVQDHIAHRSQTVQDNITHPPTQQYHSQSVHGHISTPVTTRSEILQQRKRHRNPSYQSGRSRRRRVEADSPTPTQSLIDAHNSRKAATARFPPKITPQHICTAMRRYEQVIQDACSGVEMSCVSCGEFGSGLAAVDEDHLRSMEMKIGVRIQLDHCGIVDGYYQFCQACLNALDGGRIPKFSAMNAVNITMCQDYPAELEDLTLTEEYAIARCHPIGAILKLKPNGLRNPTAYNGIRGHIVTIPQNSGPLLDILPSPDLQFHDHIRIVWTGKKEPTVDDLKPFVEVRKEKVIQALLWLCENKHCESQSK